MGVGAVCVGTMATFMVDTVGVGAVGSGAWVTTSVGTVGVEAVRFGTVGVEPTAGSCWCWGATPRPSWSCLRWCYCCWSTGYRPCCYFFASELSVMDHWYLEHRRSVLNLLDHSVPRCWYCWRCSCWWWEIPILVIKLSALELSLVRWCLYRR